MAQSKLKSKRSYINVPSQADDHDMAVFRTAFPEYDFVTVPGPFENHLRAHVMRIALERSFHDQIATRHTDPVTQVIDVGGSIARNFFANRMSTHTCAPNLSPDDSVRHDTSIDRIANYKKSTSVEYLRNVDSKYYCKRIAQSCNVQARNMIFVDSAYDISPSGVADCMQAHGSQQAMSCMIFDPMMLSYLSGHIDALNVSWRVITLNGKRRITFSFDGDCSKTYIHNYDVYISKFVAQVYLSSNGADCYRQEIIRFVGGYATQRIIKISGHFDRALVSGSLPVDRKKTVVLGWFPAKPRHVTRGDSTGIWYRRRLRRVMWLIDTVAFDNTIQYAMRSARETFNFDNFLAMFHSYTRQIIVNGTTITDPKVTASAGGPISVMYLAVNIYVLAYRERFNAGVLMSSLIGEIRRERNDNRAGILGYLKRFILSLFPCLTENLSDDATYAYADVTVPMIANDKYALVYAIKNDPIELYSVINTVDYKDTVEIDMSLPENKQVEFSKSTDDDVIAPQAEIKPTKVVAVPKYDTYLGVDRDAHYAAISSELHATVGPLADKIDALVSQQIPFMAKVDEVATCTSIPEVVPGDGNCLFHAMIKSEGLTASVAEFKARFQNATDFPFILETTEVMQVQTMRLALAPLFVDKAWGSINTALFIANVLKHNVCFHNQSTITHYNIGHPTTMHLHYANQHWSAGGITTSVVGGYERVHPRNCYVVSVATSKVMRPYVHVQGDGSKNMAQPLIDANAYKTSAQGKSKPVKAAKICSLCNTKKFFLWECKTCRARTCGSCRVSGQCMTCVTVENPGRVIVEKQTSTVVPKRKAERQGPAAAQVRFPYVKYTVRCNVAPLKPSPSVVQHAQTEDLSTCVGTQTDCAPVVDPIKASPVDQKFFKIRHKLFSRYDEGIILADDMWFSVTPEEHARTIAHMIPPSSKVLDPCCGAGGDAIQLAVAGHTVTAADVNRKNLVATVNNAAVYDQSLTVFCANVVTHEYSKHDVIVTSPPWGGNDYDRTSFDLELMPIPMSVLSRLTKFADLLVFHLPKSTDTDALKSYFPSTTVTRHDYRRDGRVVMSTFFIKHDDNVAVDETEATVTVDTDEAPSATSADVVPTTDVTTSSDDTASSQYYDESSDDETDALEGDHTVVQQQSADDQPAEVTDDAIVCQSPSQEVASDLSSNDEPMRDWAATFSSDDESDVECTKNSLVSQSPSEISDEQPGGSWKIEDSDDEEDEDESLAHQPTKLRFGDDVVHEVESYKDFDLWFPDPPKDYVPSDDEDDVQQGVVFRENLELGDDARPEILPGDFVSPDVIDSVQQSDVEEEEYDSDDEYKQFCDMTDVPLEERFEKFSSLIKTRYPTDEQWVAQVRAYDAFDNGYKPHGFCSRAGYKLSQILYESGFDMTGKLVTDLGSAPGGFAQCAIAHGAAHVEGYSIATGPAIRFIDDNYTHTVADVHDLTKLNGSVLLCDAATGDDDYTVNRSPDHLRIMASVRRLIDSHDFEFIVVKQFGADHLTAALSGYKVYHVKPRASRVITSEFYTVLSRHTMEFSIAIDPSLVRAQQAAHLEAMLDGRAHSAIAFDQSSMYWFDNAKSPFPVTTPPTELLPVFKKVFNRFFNHLVVVSSMTEPVNPFLVIGVKQPLHLRVQGFGRPIVSFTGLDIAVSVDDFIMLLTSCSVGRFSITVDASHIDARLFSLLARYAVTVVPQPGKTLPDLFVQEKLAGLGTDIVSMSQEKDVRAKEAVVELRSLLEYEMRAVTAALSCVYTAVLSSDVAAYPGIMANQADAFQGLVVMRNGAIVYKQPGAQANHMAWFDGESIITSDPKSVMNGKTFITLGALKVFTAPALLKAVTNALRSKVVDGFSTSHLSIVEGVPGCGKTYQIVKRTSEFVAQRSTILVLSSSREGANEITDRLEKEGVHIKAMTVDSFIMHKMAMRKPYDIVFIDEALMQHYGKTVLVAASTRSKHTYLFGDRQQIPYIERSGKTAVYHLHTDVRVSETISVSRRCPPCISARWSPAYPLGMRSTKDTLEDTVSHHEISNEFQVPRVAGAVYLVFTQDEKTRLYKAFSRHKFFRQSQSNAGYAALNTVHEFQGKQGSNVILVRLSTVANQEIFMSQPHCLVAMTRSSGTFKYYHPPGIKDTTVLACSKKPSRAELLNCAQSTGGFTFSMTLQPTSDHIMRDKLLSTYASANGLDEATNYAYQVALPDEVCADGDLVLPLPPSPPNPNVHDPLIIQTTYDEIMPGNSLIDYSAVTERQPYEDLYFTAPNVKIDMSNPFESVYVRGVPAPRKSRKAQTPVLRTHAWPAKKICDSEILRALEKRNFGAYPSTLVADIDKLSDDIVDTFYRTYCKPGYEAILKDYENRPILPATKDLQKWLDGQGPKTSPKQLVGNYEDTVGLRPDLNRYKLMLKSRAKVQFEQGAGLTGVTPAPQTVAYQDKAVNAYYSPLFTVATDRLLPLLLPNVVLMTRMSVPEFEDKVSRFAGSADKLYTVEADFSKYDKSQNHLHYMVERKLLGRLGFVGPAVDDWYSNHVLTRLVSSNPRISANVLMQRKSGDASTFIGNTLVNMATVAYCGDMRTLVFAAFAGDDSIVYSREPILDFSETVKTVFNFETKLIRRSSYYFCSRFLVPYKGRVYIMADPTKIMTNLGRRDLRNASHVEEYRYALIDQMKNYDREYLYPVLDAAVRERYGISMPLEAAFSAMYNIVMSPARFALLFSAQPVPRASLELPVTSHLVVPHGVTVNGVKRGEGPGFYSTSRLNDNDVELVLDYNEYFENSDHRKFLVQCTVDVTLVNYRSFKKD